MLLLSYLCVLLGLGLSSAIPVQKTDDSMTWTPSTSTSARPTTSGAIQTTSSYQSFSTTGVTYYGSTVVPSTPAPASVGPSCGNCTPSVVWNDVIFLIDASAASTTKNVGDMWSFILSFCESLNVQRSSYTDNLQYVRVGVIAYSDDVKVVAGLGSVSFDDMFDLDIPYLAGGLKGTNLEKAITTASEMFDSSAHRPNSRKVLFVIAPDYNPAGTTAPQKVADTFKANGGILIAFEYTPSVGEPNPGLRTLASPNYFLNNHDNGIDDVLQAQCDANCFCLQNYLAYGNSARGTPVSGCYYPVDLPSSFMIGNRNCLKNYNNGYIASVQTADKQNFLTSITNNSIYIIGLENKNGVLQWSDGSNLGSYHPYRSGPPSSSDMVIVNNGYWDLTNNRNGYWYVCESSPCSANKYCDSV
ncbi:unnamed protein product [Auanema sp. JU1783]|nr:unnamed protein product [Auanema sp. JU1783]